MLATRNRRDWLRLAMNSVLAQDYPDLELLELVRGRAKVDGLCAGPGEQGAMCAARLERCRPGRHRQVAVEDQRAGGEAPGTGDYLDNKETGNYVDIVSGEPLFASSD